MRQEGGAVSVADGGRCRSSSPAAASRPASLAAFYLSVPLRRPISILIEPKKTVLGRSGRGIEGVSDGGVEREGKEELYQ